MVKPQQKVIVYRQGIVTDSRKRDKQNQIDKSKQGMPACQRCGRYYKDPSREHYADFKNKIRCF